MQDRSTTDKDCFFTVAIEKVAAERVKIKPETHEKTTACQETSPMRDRPRKDPAQCVLRMKVIQPACDKSNYPSFLRHVHMGGTVLARCRVVLCLEGCPVCSMYILTDNGTQSLSEHVEGQTT